MTIDPFKRVLQAKPFRPFILRLADGSRVQVPNPDFVYFHPEVPRSAVIAMPDGSFLIVDLLLVSAIEVSNGRTKKRRTAKGA